MVHPDGPRFNGGQICLGALPAEGRVRLERMVRHSCKSVAAGNALLTDYQRGAWWQRPVTEPEYAPLQQPRLPLRRGFRPPQPLASSAGNFLLPNGLAHRGNASEANAANIALYKHFRARADDGVRTRDPHLGKVTICLWAVCSHALTLGFVRPVVRPVTSLLPCRGPVYLQQTTGGRPSSHALVPALCAPLALQAGSAAAHHPGLGGVP